MSCSTASALTGANVTFCPRPRGRSGCVTTPAMVCGQSSRCCSVGTAKRGVPKNAMFIACGLPFAGARELLDLPDDQILLQAAQAIDEQRPFQMIHLMLKAAGQQSRAFNGLRFAIPVEPLHHHA